MQTLYVREHSSRLVEDAQIILKILGKSPMPSLKLSLVTVTLLLAVFPFLVFSAEYRTWTADVEGFPVEAMFQGHESKTSNGVESTTVKLRKKDGTVVSVSLADLSKSDQDFVNTALEKARERLRANREKRRPGSAEEMKKQEAEREKQRAEDQAERDKRRAKFEEVKARQAAEKKKWDEEAKKREAEREKEQAEREAERKKRQAEQAAEAKKREEEREKERAEWDMKNRIAKISAKTKHRTWTDLGKKFQVEAQLLDYHDGNVQLKRKDNDKIVSMPLEKLSIPDQDYVKLATAEFTDKEPDFVQYASPDGSFKGRIPVTRLSTAPVIRVDQVPTSWSAAPDPAKIRKLDFTPKDLKFLFGGREKQIEFEGVHFCDGAPEKILTGISSARIFSNDRKMPEPAAFFVGNTKTGAILSQTYPVHTKVFGLSPDGTKALIGHAAEGSGDIAYLAVLDTTQPRLPCIAAFQMWDRSKVAILYPLNRANWADDKHILVEQGGKLVLIRTDDGTPVWSLSAGHVAFSPGKKYFIASRGNDFFLAETMSGKPIGRIAPVKGRDVGVSRFAFSPDGEKLATYKSYFPRGGLIQIQELKSGLASEPFGVNGDGDAITTWVDNTHIYCGDVANGTLIDAVERFPVWVYEGNNWNTTFFAGRLWNTPSFEHENLAFSLRSIEVPHPGLPKLSPMTDAQRYEVQPGLEVKLTVDASIPDSDKLREHVTKMLTDNGLKVVPKAPLTLAVRMQAGQQVEITYQELHDFMRKTDRFVGKAIYTPYHFSFTFEQNGRPFWKVDNRRTLDMKTGKPDISREELRGGKSIQEIVTEKTTPKSDWFFDIEIPPQIPFDKMGKSTLFP